eukprot:TRINITY_DN4833_c0_g1_i14.p4 TRINITY_DN4833_c0_g1~~TRINITY_DN4833_c0_g1_i14.p4  ORF type:complete len:210 (-),score=41.51 TRINITY_DN4833_c0_g1_i14:298-927(-)
MLSKPAQFISKQPLKALSDVVRRNVSRPLSSSTVARKSGNGQRMEIQKVPDWPGMELFRRGRGRGGLWREIDDIHNRMEQMMDVMMGKGFGEEGRIVAPGMALAVDVEETDEEFILKADVPGIPKEDIKVQMTDDGIVTIKGERKMERQEEKEGFFRSERSYGAFARKLQFPKPVKSDQASAKYDNGELTLKVPKATPEKTTTLDITIE